MKVSETYIKDLFVLEPSVYYDERGYFFESYNRQQLSQSLDFKEWVQDNESKSTKGVLRGLHYQTGHNVQGKLVRAITGKIYDVAVDLRKDSETYGQHYGLILSEENKFQLLIPRGFAHGFVVLSDEAIFAYKCDNFYDKDSEGGIRYDDHNLDIKWPLPLEEIIISDKDASLPLFDHHRPVS